MGFRLSRGQSAQRYRAEFKWFFCAFGVLLNLLCGLDKGYRDKAGPGQRVQPRLRISGG
jgi:hypothetical protein